MADVSVTIATFRRPELLEASVKSVLAQRHLSVSVEIVVIDNDPERSAEQLVSNLARREVFAVRYVSEPRPGISHARNTGVAASSGRYVAFLDDDEVADPEWLSSFLSTAQSHAADIVVGPVRPRYPPAITVPRYAQRIYDKDARLPTGQRVKWSCIANAFLLRDRCLSAAVPFDPKLGLSGGEDCLLFARLEEQGKRCVWCAEAAVTETIPAEKLRPAYLLRRAFRMGQTTAYVPSALAFPQWLTVVRWMAIGAAQACIYGPWGIVLRLTGREDWLWAMTKAASGLGKVFWHPALHIQNYRLRPAPRSSAGAGRWRSANWSLNSSKSLRKDS